MFFETNKMATKLYSCHIKNTPKIRYTIVLSQLATQQRALQVGDIHRGIQRYRQTLRHTDREIPGRCTEHLPLQHVIVDTARQQQALQVGGIHRGIQRYRQTFRYTDKEQDAALSIHHSSISGG